MFSADFLVQLVSQKEIKALYKAYATVPPPEGEKFLAVEVSHLTKSKEFDLLPLLKPCLIPYCIEGTKDLMTFENFIQVLKGWVLSSA